MKYLTFLIKFIVLLTVAYCTIIFICSKTFGGFGINKTVGWAWDITSFVLPLFLIYISTYITLFLLKVKTNMVFSVLSIIFLTLTLLFTLSNNSLFFVSFITSLLLFLSNCIYSIYFKVKSLN